MKWLWLKLEIYKIRRISAKTKRQRLIRKKLKLESLIEKLNKEVSDIESELYDMQYSTEPLTLKLNGFPILR